MANSACDTLLFKDLCRFLDVLENLLNEYQAPNTRLKKPTFNARRRKEAQGWAAFYKDAIHRDSESMLAVLSLLFPDLRKERVYTMKEYTLSRVLAKAMGMGPQWLLRLNNWRLEYKDFGSAVESILKKRVVLGVRLVMSRVFVRKENFRQWKWIKVSIYCGREQV